jgi:hypothetical protein
MWCAIEVLSDDGQSLWLTDTDGKGVRSLDDFANAAIFWRRAHAQAAIDLFLRRDRKETWQIRIVEVSQELLGDRAM